MATRTLALGLAALLALLATPPALAASGTTSLDLGGTAVKRLRAQDVRISAQSPARIVHGTVRLPVSQGLVTSSAYLSHRGALVLRRRAGGRVRKLAIRRIQVRLGVRSRIIGTIGKRRLTVLSVKATRRAIKLNARNGSASLRGGRVSLTRRVAAAIRKRLRLRRRPSGVLGRLAVDALVAPVDGGERGGGGGVGGGGGGDGPPSSGPIAEEPPLLARPATAVDLTGAWVTWHVRPSFIRYVNSGDGTTPFAGASGDPPDTTPECGEAAEPPVSLVYAFHFPFVHGWYDPGTKAAAVYFGGGVNFKYTTHGIDLDVKEPEIELAGAASRAIVRFDGRLATAPGNKRAVMVQLDTAAAAPSEAPGSVSYDRVPAAIPQGGSESVFAGFYQPGEPFGCMSVSFSYAGP